MLVYWGGGGYVGEIGDKSLPVLASDGILGNVFSEDAGPASLNRLSAARRSVSVWFGALNTKLSSEGVAWGSLR